MAYREEKPSRPADPVLTENELVALDRAITAAGGVDQWLIKQKAIRYRETKGYRTMEVIVLTDGFGDIIDIPYTRLSKQISQWESWKGRRAFGEQQKLIELDKIAQQMRFNH